MASAAFHFDALATGIKVSMTAGGTTTATLDSTVGVRTVSWDILGTDENANTWTVATPSATSTVVTAPAAVTGRAAILRCQVNGGSAYTDGSTYTAKMYIAPEVCAVGETLESSATYGWCAVVNPALRAAGSSGANATIACASGGYIEALEASTSIARLFDTAGVSTIQGRGTSTLLQANTGTLDLACASGSEVRIFEAGTQVAQFSDVGNVALLSLTGSSGGRVDGQTNLMLNAANTYKVNLAEAGTVVASVYDASNVSTIEGAGSGGTRVAATTGNLVLDCASGSVVRVTEGGTTVCDFYDSAGTRHIDFGAATIIDNTASFIAVRASSSYVALEGNDVYLNADTIHFRSEAGTTRAQIVNTGVMVLPVIAAASVSSPSAGSYALFFDSSNSDKLSKKSSGGTVTVIGSE